MELQLTGKLYHSKNWVVAECPELDIASQGDNDADAKRMLTEALTILLQETARKGTLKQVLHKAKLPTLKPGENLEICLDFGKYGRTLFSPAL